MKTHVHVVHKNAEEICVKVPELDKNELIWLPTSGVPDEIWKERSKLIWVRKRTDPVVRLYAKVESTNSLGLFEFSEWEIRQFTQDQIDEVTLGVVTVMVHSTAFEVIITVVKKSMPDVPDLMIGISILNVMKFMNKELNDV